MEDDKGGAALCETGSGVRSECTVAPKRNSVAESSVNREMRSYGRTSISINVPLVKVFITSEI